MKEFIFGIEEENSDYAEVFFGWIRNHSPELIRCKDCLWHYGTICRRNNTMFWNDDSFCSYAEREEYETD